MMYRLMKGKLGERALIKEIEEVEEHSGNRGGIANGAATGGTYRRNKRRCKDTVSMCWLPFPPWSSL